MFDTVRTLKMIKPILIPVQFLDKLVIKSKNIEVKDTILIAGTPRSGTTWLMEMFRTLPGYASLFEPVNPIFFPESYEIGFKPRKYLSVDRDWPEGMEYLIKTFSGGTYTRLPLYELKPEMIMHRLLGNKLVVKAIGLNRLLPWIARRFELRAIFFIIRHPCAVVASQLKTGFCGYHSASPPYSDIFPTLENVLEEASEIHWLDHSLLERLEKIKTREEILAATWCLDYYVPLAFPKPHPWTFIIYEKLTMEGEEAITRLFNEIGEKTITKSAIRNLRSPSLLAPRNELKVVKNTEKQLSKWKKFLSKEQIERILNVVSDFGLDFYTEDIEPDYKNIETKKF